MTTTRTRTRAIEQLANDHGLTEDQQAVVWHVASELCAADERVTDTAEQVRRTAEHCAAAVENGQSLNSLGELQSLGARLDVAVAVRQERHQAANLVARLLGLTVEELLTAK